MSPQYTAPIKHLDPSLKRPQHLAVVMDGNGRWAKARGLPVAQGHAKGAKALRQLVRLCVAWDIPYLTVFAFSEENWGRDQEEINALMALMQHHLEHSVTDLSGGDVKLKVMGNLDVLAPGLQKQIEQASEATKDYTKLTLNIAFNYGGRQDILHATKKIAHALASKEITPQDITPTLFSSYLYSQGLPDPDLLIRTSGEQRISNFLLWQCAYTELFFTDTLWPDFSDKDLQDAIAAFNKRERRYGCRNPQKNESA